MEIVLYEIQAVESAVSNLSQQRELNDLQLATVGGGVGDISLG